MRIDAALRRPRLGPTPVLNTGSARRQPPIRPRVPVEATGSASGAPAHKPASASTLASGVRGTRVLKRTSVTALSSPARCARGRGSPSAPSVRPPLPCAVPPREELEASPASRSTFRCPWSPPQNEVRPAAARSKSVSRREMERVDVQRMVHESWHGVVGISNRGRCLRKSTRETPRASTLVHQLRLVGGQGPTSLP